jgi:hypothetical protein
MCVLGGVAMSIRVAPRQLKSGDTRMGTTASAALRAVGAIAVVLIGVAFFFAIIGVFGFAAAVAALALFVVLALLTLRRPQAEETQP